MLPLLGMAVRGLSMGSKVVKAVRGKKTKNPNNIKETKRTKQNIPAPEGRTESASSVNQSEQTTSESTMKGTSKEVLQKAIDLLKDKKGKIDKTEKTAIKDHKDIKQDLDEPKYNGDIVSFITDKFSVLQKSVLKTSENTQAYISDIKDVTKKNLEVNEMQLQEQKDTQEFNEEQAYKREHEQKSTSNLKEKAVAIKDRAVGLGKGVVEKAKGTVESGGSIVSLIGKLFMGGLLLKAAWPAIQSGMGKIMDLIVQKGPELVQSIWGTVKSIISSVLDGITKHGPSIIDTVITGLKGLATTLVHYITEYGPDILAMLGKGLVTLAKETLKFIIDKGPDILLAIGKGIWELTKVIVPGIIDLGSTLIGAVWDLITSIPKALWDLSGNITSFILGAVWDLISYIPSKILDLSGSLGDYIMNSFSSITDKLAGIPGAIWDSIKAKISDFWPSFVPMPGWLSTGSSESTSGSAVSTSAGTGNSTGASALIGSNTSTAKDSLVSEIGNMLGGMFGNGGYTGDGKDDEVAGIVHKNEFVLSKEMLQKISDAATETEKDSLVKEAAGGRGEAAEAVVKKAVQDMKPSGYKVHDSYGNIIELTVGQKRAYDKIASDESLDEDEVIEKEDDFIDSVHKQNKEQNIVIKPESTEDKTELNELNESQKIQLKINHLEKRRKEEKEKYIESKKRFGHSGFIRGKYRKIDLTIHNAIEKLKTEAAALNGEKYEPRYIKLEGKDLSGDIDNLLEETDGTIQEKIDSGDIPEISKAPKAELHEESKIPNIYEMPEAFKAEASKHSIIKPANNINSKYSNFEVKNASEEYGLDIYKKEDESEYLKKKAEAKEFGYDIGTPAEFGAYKKELNLMQTHGFDISKKEEWQEYKKEHIKDDFASKADKALTTGLSGVQSTLGALGITDDMKSRFSSFVPRQAQENNASLLQKELTGDKLKVNSQANMNIQTSADAKGSKRNEEMNINNAAKRMLSNSVQNIQIPEPKVVESTNTIIKEPQKEPSTIHLNDFRMNEEGFILLGNTL
jgi:hypothetical protein